MTQEIRGAQGAQAAGGMQQVGEGYLGEHRVALAGQPPIRLDEIGTSRIPFQGFRKATRVERANAGARQQAQSFLRSLMGSVHTLDASSMLTSLNTMEAYLGRLSKLGAMTPAEHDERVLSLLAPEVESLDNASLQSLYATLVSRDLGVLREALEQEARAVPEQKGLMMSHLGTLMDLEALVVSEVSRRMAAATLPEEEAAQVPTLTATYGGLEVEAPVREARPNDMGEALLGAMVEASASASMRAETDAQSVTEFAAHHRKLSAVEAREIGDMMRQSELTINLYGHILFGDGDADAALPIEAENFSLQNMYARREAGDAVEADYAALREHVEDMLLPQVEGHANGQNRPVYGALNVSGNLRGGASTGRYGDSVVVLKESVKKLATFTLDDTFNMPTFRVSPEREQAFLDGVRALGDSLSPETAAALEDEGSELRQAFHELFSHPRDFKLYQVQSPKLNRCLNLIRLQGGRPLPEIMQKDLFLQTCGCQEETCAEATTFDNLEHLFDKMDLEAKVSMFRAAHENRGGKFLLNNADYIEAQIGKALTVDDIAEIRVPSDNYLPGSAQRQRIEAWSQRTGVKVTFFSYDDVVASATNINKMQERHQQNLTDVLPEELAELQEEAWKSVSGDWADRHVARRPEMAKVSAFLEPGSFLRGAATAKYKERVKGTLVLKTKELGLGGSRMKDCAVVTAETFLNDKLKLLSTACDYQFDTVEQKRAFMKWVLEAGNIRNEREMRMVYEGAMLFKDTMVDLLRHGATGAQVPDAMVGLMVRLQALEERYVGDLENGSDDNAAHARRFGFMGAAMLEQAGLTAEELGTVRSLLDSSEMREFRLVHMTAMEPVLGRDIPLLMAESEAGKVEHACLTLFALFDQHLMESLQLEKWGRRPMLPDFGQVPPDARQRFLAHYPTLRGIMDVRHPVGDKLAVVRPAMPAAPASLNGLGRAGRRRFLIDHCLPRYHQHERTFDKEAEYHGRTHATRTFVFAQVLGNLLREKGVEVNVDALALAAAGHDIGREQNGRDYYEAQSAELTTQLVGAEHEMSDEFRQALSACITSNAQNAPTIEAWLLHCADSLDYGRLGDFSLDHFPFMQETLVQGKAVVVPDQRLLKQLAKEADMLQQMTHPRSGMRAEMERVLEQSAKDPSKLRDYRELTGLCTEITQRRSATDTDAEVVERIENAIRYNPRTFPLLNRYYLS